MKKMFTFMFFIAMTAAAAFAGGGQAGGDRNAPPLEITIPGGITSIREGEYAGRGVTKVTIPNSVVSIGSVAFANNNLTSVVIPDSVTSIGEQAFAGNNNLVSVTLPANVELKTGALPCRMFYEENGKKAGTYTLQSGAWSYRP